MRVLLLQLPFFRLTEPNISLAMVQAALHRADVACDLRYLNLDFGRRIGRDVYKWIALSAPRYLLWGDLIFAPSLNDDEIEPSRLRSLIAGLDRRKEEGVPLSMRERYPELVLAARSFIGEQLRSIPWHDYELVGLGTLFHVAPALAMARQIKSLAAPPAVILGGSNCEGEMGEQLHRSFPFVDFVCRGEGEQLIVELCQALGDGDGAALADIRGLVWRDRSGETRCNGGRATGVASGGEHPLDQLPRPRYDGWLARVRAERLVDQRELRLPVETSRGCWYGQRRACSYCGFNGEAMTFRRKSPDRALAELRDLMRHDIAFIQCVDNIFDPRHCRALLPRLAELTRGTACQIFWEVRPGLSREQLRLLKQSGISWMQAGIESLSTPLLRLMRKGTTALQNVRFLRHAAELQLGVSWSILFGFPGEDPEDYRRMERLIPAIAHLQPPYRDHQQLRVDRFSPLFVHREGLRDVRPAPSYGEIFQLDAEAISRLAYYFEYDYVDGRDPYAYTAGLARLLEEWREGLGSTALISFAVAGGLQIIDTRPGASARESLLRGLELRVYRAAERGASRGEIASKLGQTAAAIEAVVERLVARRWLVELDGKLLGLAVPVDAWVPRGVPPLLVRDTLVATYCRRMVQLRDGFYEP